MKNFNYLLISLVLLLFQACKSGDIPVYLQENASLEDKVEDVLQRMNMEEKIALLHAQSKFSSPGVPRLGIPENWMSDGPHGIREDVLWDEWDNAGCTNDSCIAYPALTCLAATWNTEMSALYGKCIGEDARYRNKNVLLGPGVNIYRTPLGGRNFEYMGEDPFLVSRMVVPYVQEVQKNGVAACVKHFALNNQERQRWDVNPVLDDRTLYEIYLPAFKAAVQEGGAWAIMGAYNKFEGQHCCHNARLLNEILKKEWNFDGVVVSDWGGTHDTMEAVKNGLDMEFGTWTDGLGAGASNAYSNYFLADPYLTLIKEGKIGTEELDDKVRRILRLIFRTTMDRDRPLGSFATEEHGTAARKIAEEGIVLLKNENDVLPVDLAKNRRILVVGDNAVRRLTVGGGSSALKVKYEISPLEAIRNFVGERAEVTFLPGYEVYENEAEQEDKAMSSLRQQAVAAAASADCVLYIGGLNKNGNQDCEGDDRHSYRLPYGQDQLISGLAQANGRLAVVLISGNGVAMPWLEEVPAVVEAWYGGSEGYNALADILFGKVNPSGKLPFTIYRKLEDCAAHAFSKNEYPGNGKDVFYTEGIFTGYRWTDAQGISPLFAFGHGLSYTEFEYGDLKADRTEVRQKDSLTFRIKIRNVGRFTGKETVQLYISDLKPEVPKAMKELKAFSKVELQPGEEKEVVLTVRAEDLAYFDADVHEWICSPGTYLAQAGASAADIRSTCHFEIK